MKKIIFRKPKIMRNDFAMKQYISVANSFCKVACEAEPGSDRQVELFTKVGDCLNKAAKAGGFLNTKDFVTWMYSH